MSIAIQLSRLALMERLAALVPPPHKNQVLYHGVLASRAAIRPGLASQRSHWMLWSTLLKRVFEVNGFTEEGQVLQLDASTGEVVEPASLPGEWHGATTNPVVW